ncbi:hypothetical protein [Massilia sp. TN1-12]|uniref:hypothetical protein n=1 Tax=Massilia paldalensis TaxID=3377675 RepID=UPI00384C501B
MSFTTLFFFTAGVFLLSFGFKKNNRALLTFASCFWLASGVCSDFAHGFRDGWDSNGQSTPHVAAR